MYTFLKIATDTYQYTFYRVRLLPVMLQSWCTRDFLLPDFSLSGTRKGIKQHKACGAAMSEGQTENKCPFSFCSYVKLHHYQGTLNFYYYTFIFT